MENGPDWRLTGQERYLKGKGLVRKQYVPPRPDWDHDHCEFCWRKFTEREEPDSVQEGYATEDNRHWICPSCFADFQSEFQWIIHNDH